MPQHAVEPSTGIAPRIRHLPALALPAERKRSRGWTVLSILLHVGIILLLVLPPALHTGDVKEIEQGAGGAGPVGGGGGHAGGGAPHREHVRYVAVTPPPRATPAVLPPIVPPPVPKPVPKPVVAPPVTPPPQQTQPPTPKEAAAPAPAQAAGAGAGATGTGTAGAGPGTGGGVGSGTGTGRGSGTGPGTGGGTQADYPPSPTNLFLPPQPVPAKVRGFHLVAEFDVDSTGKVLGFTFTGTPDGGYNRKLDAVFKGFKFTPGTRPDGTPIRMKAQIIFDF